MKKLSALLLIGAAVAMAGYSPAADASGSKKQADSALVKQIRDKIDNRDYYIYLGWDESSSIWAYDKKKGNTREGFLHVVGDTLFAYTHQEEGIIYDNLYPKKLPRGMESAKYKILGYTQEAEKKGRIFIRFKIDMKAGMRVAPVCYPLPDDNIYLAQDPDLHYYTYYTLQVDNSGQVQVSQKNKKYGYEIESRYIGAIKLNP